MGIYADLIFPWMIDRVEGPEVRELRARCVAEAAGEVLEIGLGTGKTLPHYSTRVTSLTALEPSNGMNRRAQRQIAQATVPVRLVPISGDKLPFADASFDESVITMTLCSVEDQSRVLSEVYRVLRPRGRYHFLEHVVSTDQKYRRIQNRLNWLNRLIGCGCNLNRDTEASIRKAGFEVERLQRIVSKDMPLHPEIFPAICGIAVKH